MFNKKRINENSIFRSYGRWFIGFSSIIVLLTAASGYLFLENRYLETELLTVTHESEILGAEVPDPVFKYSPILVNANDPKIKNLARSLGGPEQIYLYVRDNIEYSESYDKQRTAVEVLENGKGDCLGQADLLASLLLAYGYTEQEVRVNMGYVTHDGERRHHAWVEFDNKGKWMVLDPSRFLGMFGFNDWDTGSFYRAYDAQPYVEFNDKYVHVNLN